MVDVHRENNSQVVNVVPVDNTQNVPVQPVSTNTRVNGTNDKTKYYSDLAKHYAELAEDYADNADTSADNALISATSADNSAGICTGVLENEHFQTVYTDLESENSYIEAVGNNIENVNDVAENLSDINSIVTNLNDINNVASDLTSIDNVASNISSINSVANDLTNIDTVKDNLTAINTNATNIVDIQNASANAQIAITKASEALQSANNAHSSEVNAGVSEDNAEIWAEGTDEEVQALGGVHSSKGWANVSSQEQIQTDWLQSDNTQKDYIKNKPTNLSDFADNLGTNPVHTHNQYLTSHQDISGKEDIAKAMNVLATSGTITLTDNSVNSITPTGNVTFILPTITDDTKFHQILVQINMSNIYTFDVGTYYFFNQNTPDLSEIGLYNLIFEYDNTNQYWVCGLINKGLDINDFTQPILTANGTLGGSKFAVYASAESSTTYTAYKAMDGDTSTTWRPASASATFTLYNPKPLCVNNLSISYSYTSYTSTIAKIEISDDNVNWTEITFVQGGTSPNFEYTLNNTSFAKYYRLTFGTSTTPRITEIEVYGKVWNI